jgi:hypothetical protein
MVGGYEPLTTSFRPSGLSCGRQPMAVIMLELKIHSRDSRSWGRLAPSRHEAGARVDLVGERGNKTAREELCVEVNVSLEEKT